MIGIPEITTRFEPRGWRWEGLAIIACCPFYGRGHVHGAGNGHCIAHRPPGTPAYEIGYIIQMDSTS